MNGSRISQKDITDEMMLEAIRQSKAQRDNRRYLPGAELLWPADYLPDFPEKVIEAKMRQMVDRRIIEYGVTLRSAWIIEETTNAR